MAAKERNESYDIPEKGALILVHGRVHEVTETWEATGPRIGERAGYYTRHDPGDGTGATKHVHDEGTPWRPATGQPWDEDRTTPAERALRIRTLALHADRDALQTVLEAGALALMGSGHESRTVERLAAAIAGTFDPYPPEYALNRKVHLLNGDEARVIGRYLNGYGKWEYLVRHGDGTVWKQAEGNLFQAWLRWTEPKSRPPKPESEAVLCALDVLIAEEGDPGEELESLNFDALALRNLREGRLAVGGTERRREIARRLRELEDPTGEVTDFAERLEASVKHALAGGESGTIQGAYGAWVFPAPSGTYIVGGSVYYRLATEDGQHGYLAVSPDAGAGTAFATQNDNQGHETGIPAGNWRYLVIRLECTQPNEGNRCVGQASGALASAKQIRIALADVSQPTLQTGGSLFSGAELRGPQTVEVGAADQGAGLQSIQISVNGTGAAGDDLSGSCNPLPGALTSRLVPCPLSFSKTYTLDTAQPPFKEGMNTVTVCAFDYAQTGTRNSACTSHEVLVNNLCPGSSVAGGKTITAGFAGNQQSNRTLSFHRKALIRGRLLDSGGQPVAGAQVCVQAHTDLEGRPFHLVATTTTNQNGGWSYKTNPVPLGSSGLAIAPAPSRPRPNSRCTSAPARRSTSARTGRRSTRRSTSPANCQGRAAPDAPFTSAARCQAQSAGSSSDRPPPTRSAISACITPSRASPP